jgi:HptB-dependent secretion and biofilm anti anti-sigma factor
MPLTTHRKGGTVTFRIDDRFDYSLHREFHAAHDGANDVSCYVVDLTGTGYMDSSALGMLLLLRGWAQECGAEVRILTRTRIVRKVLELAHFEKLFHIE